MRSFKILIFLMPIVLLVLPRCSAPTPSAGSIVTWGDRYHRDGLDVPSPNEGFTAISAGGDYSVGLKEDGSILCWGYHPDSLCDVPSPNADFVAVSAGWQHSLGLKEDGSVVAWGANYNGQCDVPLPNEDFVAISAGDLHSLGLKENGSIIAWGGTQYYPELLDVPFPNEDFVAISAGELNSLGLKEDGSIVSWGPEIVTHSLTDNSSWVSENDPPSPNTGFISICAGHDWSSGNVALREDGSIVVWGEGSYSVQENIPSPNADFVAVSGGCDFFMALTGAHADLEDSDN